MNTSGSTKGIADALRDLMRAYVGTLENARDRIIFLGGDCDSLDKMVSGDPALRAAREALEQPDEPAEVSGAIQWSGVINSNEDCSYTHVIGQTAFGRILITWKGWKDYFDASVDESPWGFMSTSGNNIEQVKQEVEAEYTRRLRLGLTKAAVRTDCYGAELAPIAESDGAIYSGSSQGEKS